MKRFCQFSLLPLLLSFAFAAQAVVSVDHIHITPSSEVDCSICLAVSDLVPANSSDFYVSQNSESIRPMPVPVLGFIAGIAQRSRAPPFQI